MNRVSTLVIAVFLLIPSAAHAELRQIEIKTLGMD
jgi:hypothetical protein